MPDFWAKVESGQVISTRLPRTGRLSDGRYVSNYNQLPENALVSEGWLPGTENKPGYNAFTERLNGPTYEVQESSVTASYTVEQIPDPEPLPPRVDGINLAADKIEIAADGNDCATVTATITGHDVDLVPCYVTVNGPPAERADIVSGEVTREFSAAEAGIFRVDFYAGNQVATMFIEAVV